MSGSSDHESTSDPGTSGSSSGTSTPSLEQEDSNPLPSTTGLDLTKEEEKLNQNSLEQLDPNRKTPDLEQEHEHVLMRKATHKLSEKKRRKAINKRYDDLKSLLPGMKGLTHSKQVILKKAFHYVESLKADSRLNQGVVRELAIERERNISLEAEHKHWQEKLQLLRQQKGLPPLTPEELQGVATSAIS
ncbi:uncharacterized protein [Branchiostoma lanceolatum]|uniref:uncharacterized protein n=1 Tax=Branchiostoma lanceolatum TaxID=7740 RepID=UPI003453BE4F